MNPSPRNPGIPQILKGRDHQHVSKTLSLLLRVQYSSFLLIGKHKTEMTITVLLFLRKTINVQFIILSSITKYI